MSLKLGAGCKLNLRGSKKMNKGIKIAQLNLVQLF